jgi:hypothetical protein
LGKPNSGLQLSDGWIENVRSKLPPDSPARQALDAASKNGQPIHKAVAGIDHADGQFKFIPVAPPSLP